ncbi:MAG: GNAT family N-acetyltransferase [Akkermansiaceae bacterium]|nr:GNAT family N-acetyltransferase [Akkermansiaceae bacterium]
MEPITLRPLGGADLPAAAELLGFLNPSTPCGTLRERLATILAEHPHYRLTGAFSGERLVGLTGAWIATKVWCGKYLEVDNLVVHPDARAAKIGTRLIENLEATARAEGCEILVLDSYTSNHPSHRLYHRLGFEIWGFHFVKPLNPT